jgi:hypothetical protein
MNAVEILRLSGLCGLDVTYANSTIVTATCNQAYSLNILSLVFLLFPREDLEEDRNWKNLAWKTKKKKN